MRLKSGNTSTYAYFVALADTGTLPGVKRMPGYASKFRVKRSRNGGVLTTYTTPTVNQTDTGGDGIYEVLLDEDTTLAAGNFTEEYLFHVEDTGGHVRPLTRTVEIYRSDTGGIADAIWAALKAGHTDTGSFGEELGQGVNVEKIVGDTGAADRWLKFAGTKLSDSGTLDTGSGATGGSASIDTGQVVNAVWNALKADHGDTGTFGEELGGATRANIVQVNSVTITGTGDTGLADTWRPL